MVTPAEIHHHVITATCRTMLSSWTDAVCSSVHVAVTGDAELKPTEIRSECGSTYTLYTVSKFLTLYKSTYNTYIHTLFLFNWPIFRVVLGYVTECYVSPQK